MSNEPQNPRLHPIRAILNGALAWALGFALYMLPGIGIGMKMGYELGVQGVEKDEIPRQIQATVQNFYHGNRIVGLAAACVMGLLIYWRAHVSSRDAGGFAMKHGLLVACVPVVVELLWSLKFRFDYVQAVAILVYAAAAIAGARRGASVGVAQGTPAS